MENKIYSILEISELTGLSRSTIRKHAKKWNLPRLGNGATSVYLCDEKFKNHMINDVFPRPRHK